MTNNLSILICNHFVLGGGNEFKKLRFCGESAGGRREYGERRRRGDGEKERRGKMKMEVEEDMRMGGKRKEVPR